MPRPRQITDEQIAEAARACFLEHGPAVSVGVVAERLGVTPAALFKRMRTKEELLVAAMCPTGAPPAAAQLARGPAPDRPIVDQLVELLLGLQAFFREVVPSLIVLRSSGIALEKVFPPGAPTGPMQVRRELAAWLRAAEKQGRLGEIDAPAVADALLGALESRCFLEHIGGRSLLKGSGSDATWVRRLVEAFWTGLSKEVVRNG